MTEPKITVYGAVWCGDCRRTKRFLDSRNVPYTWVDIEGNEEAEIFVRQKNSGKRIIPTILFEDGSFLAEPSDEELAGKLGIPA